MQIFYNLFSQLQKYFDGKGQELSWIIWVWSKVYLERLFVVFFSNWAHEHSTTEPNCTWSQPGKWIVFAKSIMNVFLTRSSLKEFFHTVRTFCHAWKQMLIVIFVKLVFCCFSILFGRCLSVWCLFLFLFILFHGSSFFVCFFAVLCVCLSLIYFFVSNFVALLFVCLLGFARLFCVLPLVTVTGGPRGPTFQWFLLTLRSRAHFFWVQVGVREVKQTIFDDQMRFPTTSLHVRVSTSPNFQHLGIFSINSWREFGTRVAFECGVALPKRLDPYAGLVGGFRIVARRLWDGNGGLTNYRTS